MKKLAISVGTLLLTTTPLTMMASTVEAATQSYVETQHGWVDYHSQPKLSSPITGRLHLGDKAALIGKANAYWYEIQVNGKDVYITTNQKYTKVVQRSAPARTTSSTVTTASYVETQHGWVDYHSQPKLSSPITGRLHLGDKAPLIGKANAYWYEIQVNGKDVYITTNQKYTKVVQGSAPTRTTPTPSRSTSTASTNPSASYIETNHGWVAYRSGPSLKSPSLGRLQLGDKAVLIRKYNSYWYEISVNGQTAYITTSTRFVHVTNAATTSTVPGVNGSSHATNPVGGAWKTKVDAVIAAAKTQLGVPYWWGHQVPGKGFDCSNFVEWAYHTALGVKFSTSSRYQRNHVGTPVALSDIREGDLLFFKTANNPTGGGHVGIYLGNGQIIQEGGGRGKVTIEPLKGTWFGRNLVFARRIIQ